MGTSYYYEAIIGFSVNESDFICKEKEIFSCPRECLNQGNGKYCSACGNPRKNKYIYTLTPGCIRFLEYINDDIEYAKEHPDHYGEYFQDYITGNFFGFKLGGISPYSKPTPICKNFKGLEAAWKNAKEIQKILLGEEKREIALHILMS